jgi:hypothetical protein
VIDCELIDGDSGTSSYQIDLPNGGALLARGNRIQKGPRSDNPKSVIILGEEGATLPPGEILIEDNILTVDGLSDVVFVRNNTPVAANLVRNKIPSNVQPLLGPGTTR